MASRNDITYGIGADTRPAQRQIQQFIRQAQRQINGAPLRLNLNARGFSAPLGRITSDLNQFQGAMDASIARTLAFGASVGIINGVARAFKNLAETTIRVEEALAKINVLLNLNQKQLSNFSNSLFDIAKNTAQSFDQVAIAATEFSRQGLSAAETGRRVNSALILTRLSGLDAAKSVESLTAAVNGFRKESLTTAEVVNRLANVDAAFAVSSADLANALARAGAVSQDAKVSFNELLAATTAVQQATARGGSVIGNGFKTIFTRLQRSKVLDELENIGVATRTSTGSIRAAIDILKDYAKIYQTLGDEQRAFTAEQIAGVFQINTLKAFVNDLSNEFGVYNRALAVANNTSDEAIQRNARLNETLQSLISQTGTEFERLSGQIGKVGFEDNFKAIFSVVRNSLESLSSLMDSEGVGGSLARGIVAGIGNFLAGPGLVIIGVGLFKLLRFTAQQTAAAFKSVALIGTETQKRQVLQERITRLLQQDSTLMRDILSSNGSSRAINQAVEQSIRRQNEQLLFQKNLVTQISTQVALSKSGSLVLAGRGGIRGRRAAEGYIPNLIKQEQREMPAGSKVVMIPNFKTDKGKMPMVMNTSETFVPNLAGSGRDAVFTRDQMRGMGAARGFIPNYNVAAAAIRGRLAAQRVNPVNFPDFNKVPVSGKLNKFQSAANLTDQIVKKGAGATLSGRTITDQDVRNAKRWRAARASSLEKGGGKTAKQKRAEQAKKSKKKSKLNIYNANDVGAFMAVPTAASAGVFVRNFTGKERPEAIMGGKRTPIDQFIGQAFPVDQKATGNTKSKISGLSKIGEKLDQAIIVAAKFIGRTITPNTTDPNLRNITRTNLNKFLQKGGKGALEGAKGAFFEGVVNSIVGGASSKRMSSELDINISSGSDTAKMLRDIFNLPPNFTPKGGRLVGDFKISSNSKTRGRFARQVAKEIPYQKRGRSASKGYIPNFASKRVLDIVSRTPEGERAMKTEKALAGSARMGFDPRVGFGVFNKGQGTLSGAINEHLASGDRMSSLGSMGRESQMGMSAAAGYIPNFQRIDLGTARPSLIKRLENEKSFKEFEKKQLKRGVNEDLLKEDRFKDEKFRKSLKGRMDLRNSRLASPQAGMKSVGAGLALSFAVAPVQRAGQKAETFEGKAAAGIGSAALQGASIGATIGSVIPGVGTAVGAAGGAIIGTGIGAFNKLGSVKKAAFEFEKLSTKAEETGSALAQYEQALIAFESAVDPKAQMEAQKAISEAALSLNKEQRERIKAGVASGDSTQLQAAKLQQEDAFKVSLSSLNLAAAEASKAGGKGIFTARPRSKKAFDKRRELEAGVSSQIENITRSGILGGQITDKDFENVSKVKFADATKADTDAVFEKLGIDVGAQNDRTLELIYNNFIENYEDISKSIKDSNAKSKKQKEELKKAQAQALKEEREAEVERLAAQQALADEMRSNKAAAKRRGFALAESATDLQFRQREDQIRLSKIQADPKLSEAEKLSARGEIAKTSQRLQFEQIQKQTEGQLANQLVSLQQGFAGKEGEEQSLANVLDIQNLLADDTRSQKEILQDILKNNTLLLDKNGDVFLTLEASLRQMQNNDKNNTRSLDLISKEIQASQQAIAQQEAEQNRAALERFISLPEDISEKIKTAFQTRKGGLRTDQALERARAVQDVDKLLAEAGVAKGGKSRELFQKQITQGGRLSSVIGLMDALIPGIRNKNFRFKNAEQAAILGGRKAQEIARNTNLPEEQRKMAATFALAMVDLFKQRGGLQIPEKREEVRNLPEPGNANAGISLPGFNLGIQNASSAADIKEATRLLQSINKLTQNLKDAEGLRDAFKRKDASDELIQKQEAKIDAIESNIKFTQRLLQKIIKKQSGEIKITTHIHGAPTDVNDALGETVNKTLTAAMSNN